MTEIKLENITALALHYVTAGSEDDLAELARTVGKFVEGGADEDSRRKNAQAVLAGLKWLEAEPERKVIDSETLGTLCNLSGPQRRLIGAINRIFVGAGGTEGPVSVSGKPITDFLAKRRVYQLKNWLDNINYSGATDNDDEMANLLINMGDKVEEIELQTPATVQRLAGERGYKPFPG